MGKLWIEDEHLRLDSGARTKAISPAVVAASRVTDIPAHYCDWFFERLRRGYLACPVVGSLKKMHRYVSFANTQFIVFFSKNPRPLINYLPRLKEKNIDFYINYTLNDYSHLGFESGLDIDEPLQKRIDTFKRLSDAAGPERVVWHFDPLILSPKIKIDTLLGRISSIAEQLKGYTCRLVFGFLNVPKDSIVESNLKARKLPFKPWKKGLKEVIVQEIAKANNSWGFELSTCSDADSYARYEVKPGRCVDYQLIASLAWHNEFLMNTIGAKIYTYDTQPSLFGDVDPLPAGAIMLDSNHYILPEDDYKRSNNSSPSENQCRCNYSFDIGMKGTCTYKCAYCFAAEHSYRLEANVKAHSLNPTAPSLTGETDKELRITTENRIQPKGIQLDRSLKSMNNGRVELDEKVELSKDDPLYILAKKIYSNKDEFTLKDIERIKRWYKDPSISLGDGDLSFLDDDIQGVKFDLSVEDTDNAEVIIDPEDEIDPFFEDTDQDSDDYLVKDELEDSKDDKLEYLEASKTDTKNLHPSNSSDSLSENTAQSDSPKNEGNQEFNPLEYLNKLRESKRFNSEQEVLEEFVKRVNKMVIGENDEIIRGVPSDEELASSPITTDNNKPENQEGKKGKSSDRPVNPNISDSSSNSSSDEVSYDSDIVSSDSDIVSSYLEISSSDLVNTTNNDSNDKSSGGDLYGFLNKAYPDSEDNPSQNPEVQGISCITDYEEIQEEIEKAQLKNQWEETHRDFEKIFRTTNLETIKPNHTDEESLKSDNTHNEEETSQDSIHTNPNNNWYDFDSEISKSLESDRNSLRNMMKRKK